MEAELQIEPKFHKKLTDTSLGEEIFNISVAEIETMVQPKKYD